VNARRARVTNGDCHVTAKRIDEQSTHPHIRDLSGRDTAAGISNRKKPMKPAGVLVVALIALMMLAVLASVRFPMARGSLDTVGSSIAMRDGTNIGA
jgi:hypothetical protein